MEDIDWNEKNNKQLINAFVSIKTEKEAICFLRDLMTKSEIREFANRLEAARLLLNNVQYTEIIKKTKLSSTTIARISKWLKGPLGGYKIIIERLSKHHIHSQNSAGKGLFLY